MQDFLNKVGKQASRAANMAGSKASEIMEVSKLKSKLSDVKQAKNMASTDIGEYCYDLYKNGKMDDPKIIEFCQRIDAANEAIADIEKEIEQAKAEYAAKTDIGDPSLND